jgi:hypothetical protein
VVFVYPECLHLLPVSSPRINSARCGRCSFSIEAAAAGSLSIVARIRKSFASKMR